MTNHQAQRQMAHVIGAVLAAAAAEAPGCSTGDVSVAAGVEPSAAAQADAAAADGANRPTPEDTP